MPIGNKIKPDEYQILREGEGEVMQINCIGVSYLPSIEDDPICMARVIEKLAKEPTVHRIVLASTRSYNYNYKQTQMLVEIARIFNNLIKQRGLLSAQTLGTGIEDTSEYSRRYNSIQDIIINLLRSDPLGAYVELKRLMRDERIRAEHLTGKEKESIEKYVALLEYLREIFEQTKLIKNSKSRLEGYSVGDRSLYKNIFRPTITPNFMYTRLMAMPPIRGEQLDIYRVGENTDVTIYNIPDDIKYLYHLNPPEFKLTEDKQELLDIARNVLAEHKPREEEFLEPSRMRRTFYNIGKDLLSELAESRGISLTLSDIEEMAKILVRYTIGFGLIEVLLEDPKVQDVTINSPIGETPMYLVHGDYEECVTNIIPSREDSQSWASKFRLLSGRPLDEANPVLDTELKLPNVRARVGIIHPPLNPHGLAYAFRRHRDKPWTLPLFIKNRMMNPLSAGLISFLIDGARTMLIAGTRSSGKTSLLDSCLLEILRKYRIITCEDTLELSTGVLRRLGYNVQSMKVRSALAVGGSEMGADEGIRTSLRLGDSSLIVGEIRSKEAAALYEAMRVGALANVVAGTIHGASPYGVFDRVVNDLGVPRTSFKATDIIIVANPIKSSDGLKKWRRVVQISEVRKHWEEDPMREGGFVDLMKYNPKTDQLEATDDLINGDSEILKDIAGNVKGWAGDWDAVWDNVLLRANVKQALVGLSEQYNMPEMLEAKFVVQLNDMFHRYSEGVKEEVGVLDNKRILFECVDWIKRMARNNLEK